MRKERSSQMGDIENSLDITIEPQEYAEVKTGKLLSENPLASAKVVERAGFNLDSGIYRMDNPDKILEDPNLITPVSNLVFDTGVSLKEAVDKNNQLRQGMGVQATPAEIQAMAISEAAKLGVIFDTAPNLMGKDKEQIVGVKDNLLGLASWLSDKVDTTKAKWNLLPQRQKTTVRLAGTLATVAMALSGCNEINNPTLPVDITPNISPTVEYSPTPLTPTETQTATPTETQVPTPEQSPTPEIETITFKNSKGEEITVPEFQDFDKGITYIGENTLWYDGQQIPSFLMEFWKDPALIAYLTKFKEVPGWSTNDEDRNALVVPFARKEITTSSIFCVYLNNLGDGMMMIFQKKDMGISGVYFPNMNYKKYYSDKLYLSPVWETLHP